MRPRIACMAAAVLWVAGCADPAENTHEGIAVGNPGVIAMALAQSDDFVVLDASLPISWIGYAGCEGSDRVVYYDGTQDLAEAPFVVSAPAGEWCGLVVNFAGPAMLETLWDDGVATASLFGEVSFGQLGLQPVDGPLPIDDTTELVLELGTPGWLDAEQLGLEDGQELVVDAEAPEHEVLVTSFVDSSAVFDDLDGSGSLDVPERDAGALALPAQIQFNDDSASGPLADAAGTSGCSCSSSEPMSAPAWLLLLVGAVALGRRRTATPRDPVLG